MADSSKLNQSQDPNQIDQAAQDARPQARQYSGGDALLNAERKVTKGAPEGTVAQEPAATNFKAPDASHEAKSQNYTTTGAYPSDQQELKRNDLRSPRGLDQPDSETNAT